MPPSGAVSDGLDGSDPLDDEFSLGDGTADSRATVVCPHCGAENEIALDAGGGAFQEYVEDCQVCCRPWRLQVSYGPDGAAEITVDVMD